MLPLLSMAIAYLLGSVLFGPLVARGTGVDLYEAGSGNPGATNVERLLGPRAAAIVLALDAAKGALAVLAHGFAVRRGLGSGDAAFVALAVVLGHCAPIARPTRGGKGVATAFGSLAALSPIAGLAFVAVYAIVRRLTGFGSVASLGAVFVATVVAIVRLGSGLAAIALGLLAFVVFVRHVENLQRLRDGTEPRAGASSRHDEAASPGDLRDPGD